MKLHPKISPPLLVAILTGVLACGGFAGHAAEEPSAAPLEAAPVRSLEEAELKQMLTETLQRDFVKDRGELELNFTRAWATLKVPDEPLTLKVLELPNAGVSPNFIVRFELITATRSLGKWQMPVTAQVWRDVLVTQSPMRRGQAVADSDLTQERRDVLALRDAVFTEAASVSQYEIAGSVSAGSPLYQRDVKPRTLVRRGQAAEAVVRDGALAVSMKVEVLEDGSRGQQVRVRNLQSRRELRGKVQDEKTILVSL